MTSPNRTVFRIKAAHPRLWKQWSKESRRLWMELVEAGVEIETARKQIKRHDNSDSRPTPKGQPIF